MSMLCELALPFVVSSAVLGREVVRPLRAHSRRCLRCQARAAAMRRSARALAMLSGEQLAAPRDLEWRVLSSLDLASRTSMRRPIRWEVAIFSISAALLIWRLRPRTT